MLAVVKPCAGPGAELKEVPKPECGPNDVLVKVKATSICGTDVYIYEWNKWAQSRIKPPLIFGHEVAGEVVETGKNVSRVKKGDLVSAETHVFCGKCFQCLNGNKNVCETHKVFGIDIPGVFAEYALIPEQNAWVNPEDMKPEIASIQEPFGNAVHAVFDADGVEGKTVAIFGCGPIGLFSILICKAVGASKVFAVEINDYRIKLAEKLGPDLVIHESNSKAVKEILDATGGRGADVFLEMAGSPKAFQHGMHSLRTYGRASILGLFPKPVEFDVTNDLMMRSLRISGINGRRIWGTWEKTRELLGSGKVDPSPVITHTFKGLDKFDEAMGLMVKRECGKVVLFP